MKKQKKMRVEDRILYGIVITIFVIFALFLSLFAAGSIFAKESNKVDESEVLNSVAKNKNKLDLARILEENSQAVIREEKVTEIIDIEYITQYIETDQLPKGMMQVLQEGKDGKQEAVIIKKFEDDMLVSEEVKSNVVIKAASKKIVQIGTSDLLQMTQIVEESNAFVSSASLVLRESPDSHSEQITVLKQNEEVFVQEVLDAWYKIEYRSRVGYVPKDCLKSEVSGKDQKEYTKSQLIANLSMDMPLNQPSNLSLQQFVKVLSGNEADKNKIFENNAEYFYYLEQQYQINGLFVAALGIHESAWGTSSLARNKNNLFGYGANDRNPYGDAYMFTSYQEGIDLVSRVLVKYYINAPGTVLYDGSQASGKYYNGNYLKGVNKIYASDKNWSNGIYKWMQYLYNRL